MSKYSNHIQFPIFLEKTQNLPLSEEDKKANKEPKSEVKIEQINAATALWRQNKAKIKPDDYEKFYEQNFHDNEKPLLYIHTKS